MKKICYTYLIYLNTTMKVHSNHFTKMCRYAYVGCFHIDCNFAHSHKECRFGVEYATKGVSFVEPMHVLDEFLPRFIVRFNDDDEEDEDKVPSSMSLSQIAAIQASDEYKKKQETYLPIRLQQMADQRMWHLVREFTRLTMTYGEEDMDCSE